MVIAVGTPEWLTGSFGNSDMRWGIIQIFNGTQGQEIKDMYDIDPSIKSTSETCLALGILSLLAGLASLRAKYNHINDIPTDMLSGFVNLTMEQCCWAHACCGFGMIITVSVFAGEWPYAMYLDYVPIKGYSFQLACISATAITVSSYFSFFAFEASPPPPWLVAVQNGQDRIEKHKRVMQAMAAAFVCCVLCQITMADRYWKVAPGSPTRDRMGLTCLWMNGTSYFVKNLGEDDLNPSIRSASDFCLSMGILAILILAVVCRSGVFWVLNLPDFASFQGYERMFIYFTPLKISLFLFIYTFLLLYHYIQRYVIISM